MSTEKSPNNTPRGITHAYRSGEGLNGSAPSYHKQADTLWQGWDKAIANSNHPGTKTYEAKRQEGIARDSRIYGSPPSKLELDRLKDERAKANAQSHLIPKGPGGATVRSTLEAERERKIHRQETRLNRQQGRARQSFEQNNKPQTRGPMRGGPSR